MTRKTNTLFIGLLGTILLGLSTWVLITLIELQTLVHMMQQELLSLDKVFGRIYSHMDRLSRWKYDEHNNRISFNAKRQYVWR